MTASESFQLAGMLYMVMVMLVIHLPQTHRRVAPYVVIGMLLAILNVLVFVYRKWGS